MYRVLKSIFSERALQHRLLLRVVLVGPCFEILLEFTGSHMSLSCTCLPVLHRNVINLKIICEKYLTWPLVI